MAAKGLRLRRSIALTSSLLNRPKLFSSVAPTSSPSTIKQNPSLNTLSFRFISSRSSGFDYNHWRILMYFHPDRIPTPEELVEIYVQTAAKVIGSVEEAKKKIYGVRTSRYFGYGFHVEVSEEDAEKLKGMPGVVCALPDMYKDPITKEYGGDKYIYGKIIPRLGTVLENGRQGIRYNHKYRDYNRPTLPEMELNGPPGGGQSNYQAKWRGSLKPSPTSR